MYGALFFEFVSLHCSVVEFTTLHDAARAINELSGQKFGDRTIYVREVNRQADRKIQQHNGDWVGELVRAPACSNFFWHLDECCFDFYVLLLFYLCFVFVFALLLH